MNIVEVFIFWLFLTEKAAKPADVKQLYVKYSSAIFFVFYSCFGTLEAAILDKGWS